MTYNIFTGAPIAYKFLAGSSDVLHIGGFLYPNVDIFMSMRKIGYIFWLKFYLTFDKLDVLYR